MRTQTVNPNSETPTLPRGNHGLGRDVVLLSQRGRLMEGVVLAVAEKGYVATRVEDITKRARVSRTTFYEQFADKEECFLAAYEAGSDRVFHLIAEAIGRAEDWEGTAVEGVRANLEALIAQPAYARAFLIEVHAAGPRALAAREQVHDRYAGLLMDLQKQARKHVPDLPKLPLEVFKAAVAAADEVVVGYLREGKAAELLDLLPTITYIHLALAGSPQLALKARDALAQRRPARPRFTRGDGGPADSEP
jgi:AcrR family transcriptional regulator